MQGFGKSGPDYVWPNNKKIAVNFVINYEEGAENSPIYGDEYAERYGGEFLSKSLPAGQRNMSMESLFEYGSRSGIWRLTRLFDDHNIPLTFFVTGKALSQNPEFCKYLQGCQHEVAGHGYRWIDYAAMSQKQERADIEKCVADIQKYTNKQVAGWYTGRRSVNTRDLLRKIGGFLYDSDSYADDLPYFEDEHLIIPYTLVNNDFRLSTSPGFSSAEDFYQHLCWTFDYLAKEDRVSLMSIGLHARISGHPGRCMAVAKFLEHINGNANVWLVSREELARYLLSATVRKRIKLPQA